MVYKLIIANTYIIQISKYPKMKFNYIALTFLCSAGLSAPAPLVGGLLGGQGGQGGLLGGLLGGGQGQGQPGQGQPQQGGLVSSLPIAGPLVGGIFNGLVYPILDGVPIAGPLVRGILGGLI
jgi:hypothetical protein